jgi:hypothetical protein
MITAGTLQIMKKKFNVDNITKCSVFYWLSLFIALDKGLYPENAWNYLKISNLTTI